jgi:hypothetical protein
VPGAPSRREAVRRPRPAALPAFSGPLALGHVAGERLVERREQEPPPAAERAVGRPARRVAERIARAAHEARVSMPARAALRSTSSAQITSPRFARCQTPRSPSSRRIERGVDEISDRTPSRCDGLWFGVAPADTLSTVMRPYEPLCYSRSALIDDRFTFGDPGGNAPAAPSRSGPPEKRVCIEGRCRSCVSDAECVKVFGVPNPGAPNRVCGPNRDRSGRRGRGVLWISYH